MAETIKRWVLAAAPSGVPGPETFTLEELDLPEPAEGEVRIDVEYFSVDAGMRSRLSRDSYAPALKPGEVIEGGAVGTVTETRNERFKEGDLVMGGLGWQEAAITNGRGLVKLDRALFENGPLKPTAAIGLLGVSGLTAYFGLKEIGRPQEGETVLVSSAAGPVGATAAQIAKLTGCRAVGIAGSEEKCAYLTSELGFDAAIDYKSVPDLKKAIEAACPAGVDVYFDNVGGEMLDTAIETMNAHGRIVISGAVSEYNRDEPRGIRNTLAFITDRLRMEGLVVFDFARQFPEAQAQLVDWVSTGKLRFDEEIHDGIEKAPDVFRALFEEGTTGRQIVKIAR